MVEWMSVKSQNHFKQSFRYPDETVSPGENVKYQILKQVLK